LFEHALLLGDLAHLLKESQVVFQVPILGDATIGNAIIIGSDEFNPLSLAMRAPKSAGKVTCEVEAGQW